MNIDAHHQDGHRTGSFFDARDGNESPQEAAKLAAKHLRRCPGPRIRRQMIEYFNNNGGVSMLAAGKV